MFDKIKIFVQNLFHKNPKEGFIQAQDYPHRPGGSGDVGDLADVRLTQPMVDSQLLTYDASTKKWVNLLLYRSAGFIDYIPSVPDGSGAITFSTNQASLYDNSTFNKSPKLYTLTGGKTGVGLVPALADNTITYVVGDYNGGSPKFSFITNVDLITESSVVPYETLYREGNDIYILNWDEMGEGLVNKIHQRLVKTERFARQSGLGLGETAGRVVTVGQGIIWNGATKNILSDFDSGINELDFLYHVASAWTESADVGVYNNTQYDNGTALVSLTNPTDYTINWIYRDITQETKVHFILGSSSYVDLVTAQAATIPSTLPPVISSMCILVGRIIVQNGAASGTIESAFTTSFAASGVTRHSDLSGLGAPADDHVQYALLVGRAGGQTVIGGTLASQTLTLESTIHATKGNILFGTSAYDEVNNRLGIGLTAPAAALNFVAGTTAVTGILFGADTNLYRSAPNTLTTDDSFTVVGTTTLAALSGLLKATAGVVSTASAGADYEVPLTFSTGLTRAVNTITSDLSTGKAGGQSVIGGTAASNNLTLSSNSHFTKGNIIFGSTSGLYWDETNKILQFTNDTNLYRSAANTLKTDTALSVGTNLLVGGTLGVTGTTTLGVSLNGILFATAGVVSVANAGTDYEVPLTFSTGLTRAVNTITSDLSTGVAGGQSAIGGTAASNSLTLSSTSNATKGNIIFGSTAGLYWDEVNKILQFTNDVNLYRNAANVLKTDDSLIISTNFTVDGTTTLAASLTGILKTTAGVVSVASVGTDYQAAGNYITALTSDVTASGPGSATATIAAAAVTLAKMANLAADSIIGNNTGSPATPLALSAAQTKTLLSLNNVENTALSSWAGTTSVTTLGTVGTGVWNATAIADGKIASALTGKTYNGLTLVAAGTGFTIAGGTTSKTLTVALDANVAGTNTGDVSLPTNHGLSLTNQVLAMGTPSSLTNATTNAVTTTTHTHALTGIENTLTISTGLTRSVNTITSDLSTGKAGSQSVIGGTAASETLTLSSTSNGTKGKILFGTSGYDEVNNRLGIGTNAPTTALTIVGPMATAIATKTNNYPVTDTDSTIIMNSAIDRAVTIPSAVGIAGRIYIVKNINVGICTVQVQGGVQTIDADLSLPLNQWESVTVQSDGANWIII